MLWACECRERHDHTRRRAGRGTEAVYFDTKTKSKIHRTGPWQAVVIRIGGVSYNRLPRPERPKGSLSSASTKATGEITRRPCASPGRAAKPEGTSWSRSRVAVRRCRTG